MKSVRNGVSAGQYVPPYMGCEAMPVRWADMSDITAKLYWHLFGESETVLDIGCAKGSFGRYKPEGCRVVGIDIEEKALEVAKSHIEVCKVDLNDGCLPFCDGSFDKVLIRNVLEHIEFPWVVVNEIARILSPGGVVIGSVPMAKARAVWNDYTHIRGFTEHALRKLFENTQVLKVRDIYPIVGFRLSSKVGMTKFLPKIMKIPGAGLVAITYQLEAVKIEEKPIS
ncbi:class I SAM-dependent methyltransferase [Candidatus Poribacteria bacterium]